MVRATYRQITYLDPVVHDWAHIQAPTLVIGGELDGQDFTERAEHIAKTVPKAKLKIFPQVGHVPHIEIPEQFLLELASFLTAR